MAVARYVSTIFWQHLKSTGSRWQTHRQLIPNLRLLTTSSSVSCIPSLSPTQPHFKRLQINCLLCSTTAISLYRPYSTNPSQHSKRDLYSRIGVSPHATQAQIKEAYYKLSMKYHPDRNEGSEEAHRQFKEITEAYSVLGQYQSRRRYDKGLLREYPPPPHVHQFRHGSGHYQSDKTKNSKYDFDEFYRAHYGEALRREKMARQKRASQENKPIQALSDTQQRLLIVTVILLVLVCGWHFGMGLYSKELKKQRTYSLEQNN